MQYQIYISFSCAINDVYQFPTDLFHAFNINLLYRKQLPPNYTAIDCPNESGDKAYEYHTKSTP